MEQTTHRKRPILVVDDEPSVLSSLERSLRRQYEVLTAASGEAALRLLREREISIIITDQRMPEMTGVELLARAHEQSPLTIGIILTGYADIQAVIDAINVGQAFRYHAKPWQSDDLEQSLTTALARYDTERQRVEALERLNQNLEQEVAARTTEIRAQGLRIVELERLRGRFVANVSHELRTPLTILKSSLDLLRRGKPEKRDYYLQNAITAEEQLEAIVLAILDFSRLNVVEDQLDLKRLALNRLVGGQVQARQAMAAERQLRLTWTPLPQDAVVQADEALLGRALDNVLVNALKYTPAGGEVQLWAELVAAQEDASRRAAVHVRDTGPGIPPEDQPYLFDPFIRGSEQRSGHISGIGIGLPLAAKILQWHGGRITTDSAPGRGSTFTLWLPVVE
ncbi:MAG: hybrid sensor histidine kinase/response regulator [Chloroflexi bacterium]|nr:hybrid sensor histidine kinase/response regulator [Chloroflexota bacterium]